MNLIERAKNIIINPKKEWEIINSEEANIPGILTGYVFPLAGAAAAAAFLGNVLLGASFRIGGSINWGIYSAILVLGVAFLTVFISAFIIDALAPSFGSEKNMGKSVQLVAYSLTPGWIGGLLAIVPALGIIGSLFGLYGFYLLYLGIPQLKKTPEDKQVIYFVVSLVVLFAIFIIIGIILAAILMPVFGLETGYRRYL